MATEVKDLAGRTSRATDDVTTKVRAIRADAEGATAAIDCICTAIDAVSTANGRIDAVIDEVVAKQSALVSIFRDRTSSNHA